MLLNLFAFFRAECLKNKMELPLPLALYKTIQFAFFLNEAIF